MPAKVEIRENGYVIFTTYKDPWGVSDMEDEYRAVRAHRDSVDHVVHVLLDVSQAHSVPPGLMRARQNPNLTHPTKGYIAIVGASSLLKTMGEVILRLSHNKEAGFFKTEEDAWTFLRRLLAKAEIEKAPATP